MWEILQFLFICQAHPNDSSENITNSSTFLHTLSMKQRVQNPHYFRASDLPPKLPLLPILCTVARVSQHTRHPYPVLNPTISPTALKTKPKLLP